MPPPPCLPLSFSLSIFDLLMEVQVGTWWRDLDVHYFW